MPERRKLTPRDRAIERLLALSNVTEANGSTPSEVRAARDAGDRLIGRHALTLPEVETYARRLAVEEAERLRGRRAPPPPRPMPAANPLGPFGAPLQGFATTTGAGTFNQTDGVFVRIIFG